MSTIEFELGKELADIESRGLRRHLRLIGGPQSPSIDVGGTNLLNFSSNDYLGLANEGSLKNAAREAIERYGTGSGASRLISGSLRPHHELEEVLAAFKGTEAALSFSSGYAAALGVITALLTRDDIIILDKLVHASIVDAARLSGAQLRVFPHNDLNRLDELLAWADRARGEPQVPPTPK
ncbi:MAG: aminotransferase class I/II-fold pyridoxal phosphate-dependent enzyme, partial [Limisphaerales bacterium]